MVEITKLRPIPTPAEAPPPVTHPEEALATLTLLVSDTVKVEQRLRITPAGIICIGIAVSAIILSAGYARKPRRRFI